MDKCWVWMQKNRREKNGIKKEGNIQVTKDINIGKEKQGSKKTSRESSTGL